MTLEEFLKALKDLKITVRYLNNPDGLRSRHSYRSRVRGLNYNNFYRPLDEDLQPTDYISKEWVTGGAEGGSCWDEGGDNPYYDFEAEEEPEFKELDTVLEHLCPKVTLFQYKQLQEKVIRESSHLENEYYGNYTTYAIKFIILQDLYNALVELNLL